MAMQEPTFLILTALASQALHGYAIMREVATLSGGEVRLQAGTLYAALDRLTDADLVAVEREEIVGGRLRRYYRLTDGGAAALEAEIARVRRNASAAARGLRARAGLRPGVAPA